MSPVRHQAIAWTSGHARIFHSEIGIKVQNKIIVKNAFQSFTCKITDILFRSEYVKCLGERRFPSNECAHLLIWITVSDLLSCSTIGHNLTYIGHTTIKRTGTRISASNRCILLFVLHQALKPRGLANRYLYIYKMKYDLDIYFHDLIVTVWCHKHAFTVLLLINLDKLTSWKTVVMRCIKKQQQYYILSNKIFLCFSTFVAFFLGFQLILTLFYHFIIHKQIYATKSKVSRTLQQVLKYLWFIHYIRWGVIYPWQITRSQYHFFLAPIALLVLTSDIFGSTSHPNIVQIANTAFTFSTQQTRFKDRK